MRSYTRFPLSFHRQNPAIRHRIFGGKAQYLLEASVFGPQILFDARKADCDLGARPVIREENLLATISPAFEY
jgi:hypothetical protein